MSKELRYLFFPGCFTASKETTYEVSARKVAEALGVELIEFKGANCCGFLMDAVDHLSASVLAARNISLAESEGLDILTLCPACFGHMTKVKVEIEKNKRFKQEVNDILKSIGREVKGEVRILHFTKMLLEDYGLEELKKRIVKPLDKIRVAPQYGCHIMKPTDYLGFDNPDNPEKLDSLVRITGVKCLDYDEKDECCGGLVTSVDLDLALALARNKLMSVSKAGADAIITICPFCHMQLDLNQIIVERKYSEHYRIPSLHYTQLLGLSLGLDAKELAINRNRIPADKLLSLIE